VLMTGPPGIPVLKVKSSPPPLSVKIPENSRYESTSYTSLVWAWSYQNRHLFTSY